MIFVVVRPKSLLSRRFLIGGLINEKISFILLAKNQSSGINGKEKKKRGVIFKHNNRSNENNRRLTPRRRQL